jgi:CRP-like cAMP-binding protein
MRKRLVSPSDWAIITLGAERQTYKRNASILQHGEINSNLYFIEKGSVRVEKSISGFTIVLGLLGEGEIFGELSLLDQADMTASASVLSDKKETEVTVIPVSHLRGVLQTHHELSMRFYRLLCFKLAMLIFRQAMVIKDAQEVRVRRRKMRSKRRSSIDLNRTHRTMREGAAGVPADSPQKTTLSVSSASTSSSSRRHSGRINFADDTSIGGSGGGGGGGGSGGVAHSTHSVSRKRFESSTIDLSRISASNSGSAKPGSSSSSHRSKAERSKSMRRLSDVSFMAGRAPATPPIDPNARMQNDQLLLARFEHSIKKEREKLTDSGEALSGGGSASASSSSGGVGGSGGGSTSGGSSSGSSSSSSLSADATPSASASPSSAPSVALKILRRLDLEHEQVVRLYSCRLVEKKTNGHFAIMNEHVGFYGKFFGHKVMFSLPRSKLVAASSKGHEQMIVVGANGTHTFSFKSADMMAQCLVLVQNLAGCAELSTALKSGSIVHSSSLTHSPSHSPSGSLTHTSGGSGSGTLGVSDWEILTSTAQTQVYQLNDVLLRQGERNDKLFQINRGRCRVEIANNPGEPATVVGYVFQGEVFGELSLVLGMIASASVVVDLEDTDITFFQRATLDSIFVTNPSVGAGFYHYLALQMRSLLLRIEVFASARLVHRRQVHLLTCAARCCYSWCRCYSRLLPYHIHALYAVKLWPILMKSCMSLAMYDATSPNSVAAIVVSLFPVLGTSLAAMAIHIVRTNASQQRMHNVHASMCLVLAVCHCLLLLLILLLL